ncbi:recombination protein NinG [Massilia violaceinigra]|uniref:Recombination protein NinG n=1 Tax=Massilia violaceinigra TaxID=2045208 RepID=A0ABY4A294_9BURK|nr:recombination protein NinG [Massilia violaceinigra]UOD28767.1 recombination protein NinG [Massilia violaceinigra]
MIPTFTQHPKPKREAKPPKGPRQRKCKVCRSLFVPRSMTHKACGTDCALAVAQDERKAAERKDDRARKQAIKSRTQWLAEAQAAFNAFIRERDFDQPCISCGRYHAGQYHAGHFRSVGAQPALRFDETNVHKQCAPCNNHLAGNIVEYRIRLVQKIGALRVELLETEHAPAKFSIEDAQRIKVTYRAKLKQLQQAK